MTSKETKLNKIISSLEGISKQNESTFNKMESLNERLSAIESTSKDQVAELTDKISKLLISKSSSPQSTGRPDTPPPSIFLETETSNFECRKYRVYNSDPVRFLELKDHTKIVKDFKDHPIELTVDDIPSFVTKIRRELEEAS